MEAPLPIEICDEPAQPIIVKYLDSISLEDMMRAVEDMLSRADLAERGLIVDMSEGLLDMTRTQFAEAGDRWFGALDRSIRVAVVLQPFAQGEQSDIIQMRNLLVGGGHRIFTNQAEARAWLEQAHA